MRGRTINSDDNTICGNIQETKSFAFSVLRSLAEGRSRAQTKDGLKINQPEARLAHQAVVIARSAQTKPPAGKQRLSVSVVVQITYDVERSTTRNHVGKVCCTAQIDGLGLELRGIKGTYLYVMAIVSSEVDRCRC